MNVFGPSQSGKTFWIEKLFCELDGLISVPIFFVTCITDLFKMYFTELKIMVIREKLFLSIVPVGCLTFIIFCQNMELTSHVHVCSYLMISCLWFAKIKRNLISYVDISRKNVITIIVVLYLHVKI